MASVEDIISRLPALEEVDAEAARAIAELFSERSFAAGEVLCRDEDPAHGAASRAPMSRGSRTLVAGLALTLRRGAPE